MWLALIPLTTLILAWTNEHHGLIWASYIPYRENGLVLSEKIYGLWFWVHCVYSYLLLLIATILSFRMALASSKIFRWQVAFLGIGILAPWVGNLLYLIQLNPFKNLDLTPLAFSITGIMLATGMARWRLFDIKPVARAAVIAGMADGMIVVDTQGRIVEVNPATQAILRLAAQEMIGLHIEQIFASQLPPDGLFHWKQEKRIEIQLTRGSENQDFELSASPFYDKDGSLGGSIIFLHDVTDWKRLQERLWETERQQATDALRLSEQRHRTILQTAMEGFWKADMQGRLLDVNAAYCRMSGYSQEELLNMSISDLEMIETSDDTVDRIQRIVARGEDLFESQHRRKDGSIFDVEVSVQYHPNEEGLVVAFLRDITERKLAEQKMLAALKEKEILLLELYHRTKNNMQVIISMLSLEAARSRSEELKAICKDIANRIYAMAMVHQKLYQSQDLSQINLRDYLQELARMLIQNYCIHPDHIALNFDIEPVEVLIDTATPFGLIVTELITNSLKHAFPGDLCGEVTLRLTRTDREIELHYSDSGVGVPADFDFRLQKTYGIRSIFALVEHQLRGQVSFEADHGLACHIRFSDTLYTRRVET